MAANLIPGWTIIAGIKPRSDSTQTRDPGACTKSPKTAGRCRPGKPIGRIYCNRCKRSRLTHESPPDRGRRTRAGVGGGRVFRIPEAFVALVAAGTAGSDAGPARQGPRCGAGDAGRGTAGDRRIAEE